MKRLILAALGLFAALLARAAPPALPDGLYAAFTVPEGRIVCQLDYQRAPLTCVNFVGLAEGTLGPAPKKPFFDGLKFHRVVPDFVIQGGDPLNTGEGGPGYMFPDEFSPESLAGRQFCPPLPGYNWRRHSAPRFFDDCQTGPDGGWRA